MKKLLPERKRQKPQIVVTNLIDVVLLLVFFFMITSSFAQNKNKMPVSVPKASNATTVQNENLTVQIGKSGGVFVAGKNIELAELEKTVKTYVAKSPDRPVLVEADKDANYGRIISVLDQIRSAGGVNIGLATQPDKK